MEEDRGEGMELGQLNTGREETKRREKIKRKRRDITCRSEGCPDGVGSGGRPAGTSTAAWHHSEPAHTQYRLVQLNVKYSQSSHNGTSE